MKNSELLNFEFVDRVDEQDEFKNYIKFNSFIWIKGDRGVGKTRFIKHISKNINMSTLIINKDIETKNETLLEKFLNELQEKTKTSFIRFLKTHYKQLFYLITNGFLPLLAKKSITLSCLVDILLNQSSSIETKDKKAKLQKLLYDYIDAIIDAEPLFIVFDNFTRADDSSIQVIVDLMSYYISIECNKIRFCIITTYSEYNPQKFRILNHIPCSDIIINKIDDYKWFMEILYDKFEFKDLEEEDIKYIYRKCDGVLENLILLLQNILEDPSVKIKNGKVNLSTQSFIKLAKQKPINFATSNLSSIEHYILAILICIGERVDYNLFKDIIQNALEMPLFSEILKDNKSFNKIFITLIDRNILKFEDDNFIVFNHDSLYLDIQSGLQPIVSFSMIYGKLHAYFERNKEKLKKYNYTSNDINEAIARYAFMGKSPNWLFLNVRYGMELYHKELYHESTKVFDRFFDYILSDELENLLSFNDKYKIAFCYFTDGKYTAAYKLLLSMSIPKVLDKILLYKFYYLLGKCQNILNFKEEAIVNFNFALKYAEEDSYDYIRILDLIHLTLTEIPNKFEDGKLKFEYIKNKYRESQPYAWAKTIRGCCNFYKGSIAKDLLDEAIEIALINNDLIEVAYAKNSKGFACLREGDIDSAMDLFKDSMESLKEKDIHESAYPVNNYAVCLMLNKKYKEAIKYLLDALLWSRTPYSYYTINCHLLICYTYTKFEKGARNIINILEEHVKYPDKIDTVVLRKIYMTLGFAYNNLDNPIQSYAYFEKAKTYVVNTSSFYRYLKATHQKITDDIRSENTNNKYYTDNFEPWILIHSH